MRKRSFYYRDAYDFLYEEAAKESARYIKKYLKDVIIADFGWWEVAIAKIKVSQIDGLCMEFGVYNGDSINYFSKACPNKIWFGFDSFEGFQEDWRGGYFAKGNYSLDGKKPKVNKNVKLIKGWFKDTLPKFLKLNNDKICFVHIDCDTYESTKEVLNILTSKKLTPGTLILFDEYLSYVGWKQGEFKAWQEFVKKNKIKYKYEMFGERQALVKIIGKREN